MDIWRTWLSNSCGKRNHIFTFRTVQQNWQSNFRCYFSPFRFPPCPQSYKTETWLHITWLRHVKELVCILTCTVHALSETHACLTFYFVFAIWHKRSSLRMPLPCVNSGDHRAEGGQIIKAFPLFIKSWSFFLSLFWECSCGSGVFYKTSLTVIFPFENIVFENPGTTRLYY